MKVGVIKLGARISFESVGTSGGTGEAISIIKMLTGGGIEVIAFTKLLKNENASPMDNVSVANIIQHYSDINNLNLEALVIINGNVNYFGGADSPDQTLNYNIINNFKGPVFYVLCDPALLLKQIWPSIEKKEWAKNYKKEDIEITRQDIIYLSQPFDTEKLREKIIKTSNAIVPKQIIHYPFEKFPCLTNKEQPYNPNPSVHLSYGGTMRGGRRAKKLLQYYFNWDPSIWNVELFGKIRLEDFPKKPSKLDEGFLYAPSFTGPVEYDKMLSKMNDAMAHIVIGDNLYGDLADIPQRTYESIWAKNIVFIDEELDTGRRVYASNKEVGNFLYVKNKSEVATRLSQIINDERFRKELVESQIKTINFNSRSFCLDFVSLIKDNS